MFRLRQAIVALSGLLVSTAANAACPSSRLANGTPADATQVMAWFDCKATTDSPTFTGPVTIPSASGSSNWVQSSANAILANDGAGTTLLNVPSTGQLYVVTG